MHHIRRPSLFTFFSMSQGSKQMREISLMQLSLVTLKYHFTVLDFLTALVAPLPSTVLTRSIKNLRKILSGYTVKLPIQIIYFYKLFE